MPYPPHPHTSTQLDPRKHGSLNETMIITYITNENQQTQLSLVLIHYNHVTQKWHKDDDLCSENETNVYL